MSSSSNAFFSGWNPPSTKVLSLTEIVLPMETELETLECEAHLSLEDVLPDEEVLCMDGRTIARTTSGACCFAC